MRIICSCKISAVTPPRSVIYVVPFDLGTWQEKKGNWQLGKSNKSKFFFLRSTNRFLYVRNPFLLSSPCVDPSVRFNPYPFIGSSLTSSNNCTIERVAETMFDLKSEFLEWCKFKKIKNFFLLLVFSCLLLHLNSCR